METTSPKHFVFVLIPFSSAFADIYLLGIKAACDEAGAYCEKVNDQLFDGKIIDRIYNQIAKADTIIADMTGRNPNVFYEVGYAHAIGKRVLLLTQKEDDIPFDLSQYQHIVYDGKITFLKEELAKKVRWSIDNPVETEAIRKAETIQRDIYAKAESIQKMGAVLAAFSARTLAYISGFRHVGAQNVIDMRDGLCEMLHEIGIEEKRTSEILQIINIQYEKRLLNKATNAIAYRMMELNDGTPDPRANDFVIKYTQLLSDSSIGCAEQCVRAELEADGVWGETVRKKIANYDLFRRTHTFTEEIRNDLQ